MSCVLLHFSPLPLQQRSSPSCLPPLWRHQLCIRERESLATTLSEDETLLSSLGKSLGGEFLVLGE